MATSFDSAKQMLTHYFQVAIEQAGGTFTADNRTEIESIVEDLEDGVYEKLEELKQELKREIEHDLQLKFTR